MLEAIGWFVLGLVLLALGGDSIVKGASGLAQRLGASPFVAGLVLVAFGTSLPELAVNLQAVARDQPALALGNAVGSNIANFGLTLGAAALVAPLTVRWRALSPLLLVLLLGTALTVLLGFDGTLTRIEGVILLVAFVVVIVFAAARTRRESPELQDAIAAFARTSSDLWVNLVRFGIAAVLLYFGSRMIVRSAPTIGEGIGMGPLVTGLIPVAIGTALPEIAAAMAAARKGHGDIVVGHVIGSSLFNLLVVIGGMAAIGGSLAFPESFVMFELPAAGVFALMLYPMLRGDLHISKGEGAGLMIAFLAWIAFELLTLQH